MNSNEATLTVVRALADANIPYMLVGSYAGNVYGVARATKDANFVVDCRGSEIDRVVKGLGSPFRLEPDVTFERVTGTTRYLVIIEGSPFRIELFRLSHDPHDQERFRRRRQIELPSLGGNVHLPTAEDVIVTKLRWAQQAHRGKDRDDIRELLAVQGSSLDWDYLQRWADQHGTRALLDEIRREIPPAV